MIRNLLRYLLVLMVVGAAFWGSSRLPGSRDLSASGRHSLSPTSVGVIDRLEGPVKLTAYVADRAELRRALRDLVAPYARRHPGIELEFVDPALEEEKARELGVPASGAVLVEIGDGSELLRQLSETTLTSALQRLMTREEHWIVSIRGHGERRLDGDGNHDLRDFAAALKREGYRLHTVDLPETLAISANTEVLLIADPRASFPLVEQAVIADWLAGGGHLLWFADPDPSGAGRWLADQMPVSVLRGTLVDAQGARMGLEDPRLIAVSSFADHPTTAHLQGTALFRRAAGLAVRATGDGWTSTTLVDTSPASWNETGEVRGDVERNEDAGETAGPLALGVALERGDQRVVVFGDADFLSNAYLGNGVNLDLGLNLVRWLTGNSQLLDIPAPSTPDARLDFSPRAVAVLASVFLMLLPVSLLTTGLLIHYRRRRR